MFDELYVTDLIKNAIKKAFNTPEWKKSFGGKTLKIVEDSFGETTTFPVVYVEVDNPQIADGTYDSDQRERYTKFWFEVDSYNQSVEKTGESKTRLGIRINQEIVRVLQEELNPHITENSRIDGPDSSVYRRKIEGYCNIDNNKKIFYR